MGGRRSSTSGTTGSSSMRILKSQSASGVSTSAWTTCSAAKHTRLPRQWTSSSTRTPISSSRTSSPPLPSQCLGSSRDSTMEPLGTSMSVSSSKLCNNNSYHILTKIKPNVVNKQLDDKKLDIV